MNQRYFETLFCQPLAISEEGAKGLYLSLRSFMGDSRADTPDIKGDIELTYDRLGNKIPRAKIDADGTAMIPLNGVVSKGLGPLGEYFGYTDIAKFRDSVAESADSLKVKRIALNIASPGGSVMGTKDAAEAVAFAAQKKPVLVYTNDLMASAAYYVAAGATAIMASTSSFVGSIGTYMTLVDDSDFWEKLGVKFMVIRSGEYKGVGIDKVTDSQLSQLQSQVDALGAEFRGFVSAFRPIEKGDMQGQVFTGLEASQNGFVDGLAGSFSEAVEHFKELT